MIVYHGSYCEIKHPDIKFSRDSLKQVARKLPTSTSEVQNFTDTSIALKDYLVQFFVLSE